MTYLELVNKVLVRLREPQVTSVSETDYSSLIGELVNQAKEDVENSWDWLRLRYTIRINTVASTYKYTITGAGERFRILSVFNDTEDVEMCPPPSQRWLSGLFNTGTPQEGIPLYYGMNGFSGEDPVVDLWPIPDSVDVLNFNMIVPQDTLCNDTDVITVPSRPVILRAYALAISERGEDGGQLFTEVDQQYKKALDEAVAIDSHNVLDELIWYLV